MLAEEMFKVLIGRKLSSDKLRLKELIFVHNFWSAQSVTMFDEAMEKEIKDNVVLDMLDIIMTTLEKFEDDLNDSENAILRGRNANIPELISIFETLQHNVRENFIHLILYVGSIRCHSDDEDVFNTYFGWLLDILVIVATYGASTEEKAFISSLGVGSEFEIEKIPENEI